MRALAALFAEDADFVDVAGQWFKGSAAILAVLTARHATVFKASRFIEAGVWSASCNWISRWSTQPGSSSERSLETVRSSHPDEGS